MIWFSERPNLEDFSMTICIPDELSPCEKTEAEDVDLFMQAIIESMSKPLKGGLL